MKVRATATAVGIAVFALLLSGCSGGSSGAPSDDPESKPQETAKLVTNYFAQAEQGGYWDAMQNQYAEEEGVTLNVIQGGPGINTIPQVASGSYDFGVAQADDILIARESGLPVVVIAGGLDQSLFVMMSHKELGITDFTQLNGHHVAKRTGALYWEYLQKTFGLNDVKEVNFAGSMAEFKLQTDLVQQGFATSDVFRAEDAGIDVSALSVAEDGGYNPYAQVMFTTESMIKEKPEIVQAVVNAITTGWTNFRADPADAKKAVLKANSDMDPELYDISAKLLNEGDSYYASPIGSMADARWNELADQLVSIGALPNGFDANSAWTDEFLEK